MCSTVKHTKKHKWKAFSVEGSRYKRCDFEEGFCDLIQNSDTLSGWFRTTEVPGLKHDHTNNTSGKPLIFIWYIHFEIITITLSYPFYWDFYMNAPPHFSAPPLAHFLSLSPVRGNRTTADLSSPAFLPSQTCQVTKNPPVWHNFGM